MQKWGLKERLGSQRFGPADRGEALRAAKNGELLLSRPARRLQQVGGRMCAAEQMGRFIK